MTDPTHERLKDAARELAFAARAMTRTQALRQIWCLPSARPALCSTPVCWAWSL